MHRLPPNIQRSLQVPSHLFRRLVRVRYLALPLLACVVYLVGLPHLGCRLVGTGCGSRWS